MVKQAPVRRRFCVMELIDHYDVKMLGVDLRESAPG